MAKVTLLYPQVYRLLDGVEFKKGVPVDVPEDLAAELSRKDNFTVVMGDAPAAQTPAAQTPADEPKAGIVIKRKAPETKNAAPKPAPSDPEPEVV